MGVVARDILAYVKAEAGILNSPMLDAVPLRLRIVPRALLAVGVAFGVLLAVTLGLWAHYGSTVFFETIAAGIAACL